MADKSIFIGSNTQANSHSETNQIVIGDSALGNGSNTVTLGNDSITDTYLKGDVTATGSVTATDGIFSGNVDITGTSTFNSLTKHFDTTNGTYTTFESSGSASKPILTIQGYNSLGILDEADVRVVGKIKADDITSTGNINSDLNLSGATIRTSTSYTYATVLIGTIAHITDASTISYRADAAGGGSDFALVVYNGTKWIYH